MFKKIFKIAFSLIIIAALFLGASVSSNASAVTAPADIELQPQDERIIEVLEARGYDIQYLELYQDYTTDSPNTIVYKDLLTGECVAVNSTTPRVNDDGEVIDPQWHINVNNNYKIGNNTFTARTNGVSLIIADGEDDLWYTPILYLNDVAVEALSTTPTLLAIDPTDDYYEYNTLVWDYGICKRYTSVYEGRITSYWVFNTNPDGEIRIAYVNLSDDIDIDLSEEYISGDNEETITVEQFSNADYPLTINDSVSLYSVSSWELLREVADDSWADLISGNGTRAKQNLGGSYFYAYYVNPDFTTDLWEGNTRGNITFNISSYATYTITGATLYLDGFAKSDSLGITPSVNIFQGSSSDGTCAASDYQAIGTTAFSTAKTYANQSTTGLVSFVLNSSAITYLNSASDYVDFATKCNYDYNSTTPTWGSGGSYWAVDNNDCYLLITYLAPPSVSTSAATLVEETTARANGYLYSTGGATTTVTLYYGDNDGGTTAGSWDNNISLGSKSVGSFYCSFTGLSQGTTYYYNFKAENSEGTVWGTSVSFTAKPEAPLNLTATLASETSITLTWNKGVGATSTYIVVKTSGYPSSVTDGTVIYNSTGTTYTYTGLTAGYTYYFRAWSKSSSTYSDSYSSDSLLVVGSPSISTSAASLIEEQSARMNGNLVSTGGATTSVTIYYGDNDGGTTAGSWDSSISLGATAAGTFYYDISGLTQGTLYYYNVYAVNSEGSDWGISASFRTKPEAPNTLEATSASSEQISLTWVKGTGANTTVIVMKVGSYPTSVSDGTVIYNSTGTAYTYVGSSAGNTYYFRAWSLTGSTYSDLYDSDYITIQIIAPTVIIKDASNIAKTTARLNAIITNAGGDYCEVRWGWGESSESAIEDYDYYTSFSGSYVTGNSPYIDIDSLTGSTTYYFRVEVSNSAGTDLSDEESFTTSEAISLPESINVSPAITSIQISWVRGDGASQTTIRFSTADFPTSTTDGILVYEGSNTSYTLSGLKAGTTYYFSFWSESGGTYSGTYETAVATTYSSAGTTGSVPDADEPFNWMMTPDYTNMENMPLYDNINYLAETLDIPNNTFWMLLLGFISVSLAAGVYFVTNRSTIGIIITLGICLAGSSLLLGMPMWILILTVIGIIMLMVTKRGYA